jgi:hypothetical protein
MKTFQILIPEFLPAVSFFFPFLNSDIVVIADHIQYKKRSNLTRSSLLKSDQSLTIPVKHNGFKKTIFEKEIAYIENWDRKHLTTIHHNYHMLPFFDDYYYKVEEIYKKHHKYLNQLLFDQIKLFTSILKVQSKTKLASKESFNDALEESLIRFSKNNGEAIFIYNQEDVNHGFIDLEKMKNARVKSKAVRQVSSSSSDNINILEYIFTYGPEAAFMLRQRSS